MNKSKNQDPGRDCIYYPVRAFVNSMPLHYRGSSVSKKMKTLAEIAFITPQEHFIGNENRKDITCSLGTFCRFYAMFITLV